MLLAGWTISDFKSKLTGGGARPNPLSVSVCRLFAIEGLSVTVEGLDLVDGTPILDLKPYVAFYDARPEATLPRWAEG